MLERQELVVWKLRNNSCELRNWLKGQKAVGMVITDVEKRGSSVALNRNINLTAFHPGNINACCALLDVLRTSEGH